MLWYWTVFAFLSTLAQGGTIPGASASLTVDSVDQLLQSVVPKIINTQLYPEHILVDKYEISTGLGPVVLKNIHIHDYIDYTRSQMRLSWGSDNSVYFVIVNATMQFDMEYELFDVRLLRGYAEAKITDFSLWTEGEYIDRGDSWSFVVTQRGVKLGDAQLNMHNQILDLIFAIVKSTLISELKHVLAEHIYPRWNWLIQRFIDEYQDPHRGAINLNPEYFISLNLVEKAVFDRAQDYIEVQFNGLTYKKQDRSTIATNDLPRVQRDLIGPEEQINLSDNALESITPYILSLIPEAVRVRDQEAKFKSFFEDVIPSLVGLFGINATYALNIHYSTLQPSYVISKGTLTMQNTRMGIELLASSENATFVDFSAVRFDFEMSNSISGSVSDFMASSQFKILEIKEGSFKAISHIGELDVSEEVLQKRVMYLMEYLMEQLSLLTNNQDLTRLIPERFKFLLEDISDVVVRMDRDEHFLQLGFSST